jgi:transposase
LITGLDFAALIGDKAFDNNWLRANLNERGAVAVIPSKADRAGRIPHDAEMYKWRHLVENFFCSIKAFRRIATRYERPMPALPAFSISSPASSQAANCKQALVLNDGST